MAFRNHNGSTQPCTRNPLNSKVNLWQSIVSHPPSVFQIIVHGWLGGSCTKTNPDLAKTSFRVMLEHCWAHVNAYAERRAGSAGGDLATIWAHVNAYATHWRPFESVIAPHRVYKNSYWVHAEAYVPIWDSYGAR